MAFREILLPWYGQPQEAVGIDPSSPLADSLWWATLPPPTTRDVVGSSSLAYHAAEQLVAGPFGQMRKYTRNGFTANHTTISGNAKTGANGWTFAGIGVVDSLATRAPVLGFANSSRVVIDTTGELTLYIASGTRFRSSNAIAAGDSFRFVMWGSGATTYNCIFNGVETNAGSGGFGNPTTWSTMGGAVTDATGNVSIAHTAAWDRIQPEWLRRLWLDNPWALFEHQRVRVPVGSAAPAFKPFWARGSNVLIGAGVVQ